MYYCKYIIAATLAHAHKHTNKEFRYPFLSLPFVWMAFTPCVLFCIDCSSSLVSDDECIFLPAMVFLFLISESYICFFFPSSISISDFGLIHEPRQNTYIHRRSFGCIVVTSQLFLFFLFEGSMDRWMFILTTVVGWLVGLLWKASDVEDVVNTSNTVFRLFLLLPPRASTLA